MSLKYMIYNNFRDWTNFFLWTIVLSLKNSFYSNEWEIKVSVLDCTWSTLSWYNKITRDWIDIDISQISNTGYNCLKFRVDMQQLWTRPPSLEEINTTRKPLPVFYNTIEWQTWSIVWEESTLILKYSLSYLDDNDSILYIELPSKLNWLITGYTISYNQNLDIEFISAEWNWIYTDTSKLINWVNIPANSIYRNMWDLIVWSNWYMRISVKIPNWTQNWVYYNFQSSIKWEKSYLTKSNLLTIETISAPNPSIEITTSNTFNNIIYPIIYKSNITYSVSFKNIWNIQKEEIFEAYPSIDMSDVYTKLKSPQCGSLNDSDAQDRIEEWVWIFSSTPYPNIYWTKIDKIGPTKSYSFSINYSWCTGWTSLNTIVMLTWININQITRTNTIVTSNDFTEKTNSTKAWNSPIYNNSLENFKINLTNIWFPRLDKILIFDKIISWFDLQSTTTPAWNLDYKLFYNTWWLSNDINIPPLFDYGDALSWNLWTWRTTTKSTTERTNRVWLYIECLNSIYMPATWSCLDKANSAILWLKTSVSLQDSCIKEDKTNTALIYIYSWSNNPNNDDGSMVSISKIENIPYTVSIVPRIWSWSNLSIEWPNKLSVWENPTYKFSATNAWADILSGGILIVDIPYIDINGQKEYMPFDSAAWWNRYIMITKSNKNKFQ